MFGFLNINKPGNCTSHDVVATLRKKLGIKKIGHSGTLDPFAEGVLVVGINQATKLFEYLDSDKEYIAEITFGIETDTNDITGKVVKRLDNIPAKGEITEKLKTFQGKVLHKPPIYSAIKIKGKKAYELARENAIEPDMIQEKEVFIYSSEIISYEENKLNLKIHCSSGTYIRSIARDLGVKLNSCATLSKLQRIRAGKFSIGRSLELSEVSIHNLNKYLISPVNVLNLRRIQLDTCEITKIQQGKKINIDKMSYNHINKELLQLLDINDKLIAIGCSKDGNIIQPVKVFAIND